MSDRSLQVKVGALILVALALLVGFIFLLGRFQVGAQRSYFIEVTDSGSILKGAPVKIAGVRAGRIEEVEFLIDRNARKSKPQSEGEALVNVRLRITVDEKMAGAVREDSDFFITTQGVLGEKYMEIVPGSASAPEIADGAYIRGEDPARLDLIFSRVSSILSKVEGALDTGGEGLDIGGLVTSLTKLTRNIDEFLVQNRERLDRIAVNLETTTAEAAQLVTYLRTGIGSSENVETIVQNVKRLTTTFAREADPLVASARRTLDTADTSLTSIKAVIDENRPRITAALGNLEPITEHARTAMRDVAAITAGLTIGRGTVGQLIIDQEIYDDLKEMLRDLKRHPWKMLWKE